EAGTTEGLQRLGQVLVGALGADTLDDGQQQVVDAGGHVGIRAGDLGGHVGVLVGGGVEVDRAQALGVGLLGGQAAAHVRVVGDGDARGVLGVGGQVGALHAVLGVVQRAEVVGGQGGDGLGADHHAGVL